jgi:hypothetical protein
MAFWTRAPGGRACSLPTIGSHRNQFGAPGHCHRAGTNADVRSEHGNASAKHAYADFYSRGYVDAIDAGGRGRPTSSYAHPSLADPTDPGE